MEAQNVELPGTYAKTDMGWANHGLWTYRILPEPILSETLERYAQVQSHANNTIDSITFQPCPDEDEASQDRRIAGQWDLPDGKWTFAAIFDGNFIVFNF